MIMQSTAKETRRFAITLPTLVFLMVISGFGSLVTGASANSGSAIASPSLEISPADLKMEIKHLTADELLKEADRWQEFLAQVVYDLNQEKIRINRENEKIAAEQEAAGSVGEEKTQEKEDTLDRVGKLREQRVQVIDRFNIVIDELSAKRGQTSEGVEQESVRTYRLYIDAVDALQVDVSDTQSTRATVVAWVKSSEGGLRLLRHLGVFLAIVVGSWLLGLLLSKMADKAFSMSESASMILKKFVVDAVRRISIMAGILIGLAAMGVNITPLVAVIGAAGFVIAFALQSTLSNFASGLMIMLYKPFDIGDFVDTPSASGTVKSMTLVTTNMITPDNKLLVVPNNELWGNVITNVTGSTERRVDMTFCIGYNDDIDLAERVLADILSAHPLVLEEPEPVVRVSALADSSVDFICRPWVKTSDYWPVYWELTRIVKDRFDEEGLSIPFPQQDIHVYTHQAGDETSNEEGKIV